jgi:hypothetical protein
MLHSSNVTYVDCRVCENMGERDFIQHLTKLCRIDKLSSEGFVIA